MRLLLLYFVLTTFVVLGHAQEEPSFDFDLENQPGYLLAVPVAIEGSQKCWGPKASDITLILQLTTFVNLVWFDVLAAYNPTTKGSHCTEGQNPILRPEGGKLDFF